MCPCAQHQCGWSLSGDNSGKASIGTKCSGSSSTVEDACQSFENMRASASQRDKGSAKTLPSRESVAVGRQGSTTDDRVCSPSPLANLV
eukprot:7082640-Pyramimonas_sp.AAC.1